MPNGTPRQTRNGSGWGVGIVIIIIALIIIGWGWGWGGWSGGHWWGGHNANQTAANGPTNNTGTPKRTLDNSGTGGSSGTANAPANKGTPAH